MWKSFHKSLNLTQHGSQTQSALLGLVGILPGLLQMPHAHTAHRGPTPRAGFRLILKAKGDDLRPLFHAAHRAVMFTCRLSAPHPLLQLFLPCCLPRGTRAALTTAAQGFSLRAALRPLSRPGKTRKFRTPSAEPPKGAERFPGVLQPAADSSKGKLKINPKSAAGLALRGASASCSGTAAGTARLRGRGGGLGADRRVTAAPHRHGTTAGITSAAPSPRSRRPRGGRRRGRSAEGSPGRPGPDRGAVPAPQPGMAPGGGGAGPRRPHTNLLPAASPTDNHERQ